MKKLEKLKNNGITLIALIITIIVLLILAGVTIATLTGENGILTRANEAKNKNQIGEEKEAIGIAYNGVMTENKGEEVTAGQLQNELRSNGYTNATAVDNADGTITVTFETENAYIIDTNGNISGPSTGEITPPNGNIDSTNETTPFLPDGATIINNDLATGLTIKDSNNNEWVWIEVPKSITENANTNKDIEKVLKEYTKTYTDINSADEWYDGCGLEEQEYYDKYNEMLQSIKVNGGFYIGKYEVGSFDNPVTAEDTSRKAVIQKGAYPYNWINCSQAQKLAKDLFTDNKNSSGLMYGLQWDLVCKYIEENAKELGNSEYERQLKIINDSSDFGNYQNTEFQVSEGNKYAVASNWVLGNWNIITTNYNKPIYYLEHEAALLTTGATERNKILNIYDMAGNVLEWTLEKSISNNSNYCIYRGGDSHVTGTATPLARRSVNSTSTSFYRIGFRATLW